MTNQDTLFKYIKKAGKRLYEIEVSVVLEQMWSLARFDSEELRVLLNVENFTNKIISFDPEDTIKVCIHELTHFKHHITINKNNGRLSHSKEFTSEYNKNLGKCRDLIKHFVQEIK